MLSEATRSLGLQVAPLWLREESESQSMELNLQVAAVVEADARTSLRTGTAEGSSSVIPTPTAGYLSAVAAAKSEAAGAVTGAIARERPTEAVVAVSRHLAPPMTTGSESIAGAFAGERRVAAPGWLADKTATVARTGIAAAAGTVGRSLCSAVVWGCRMAICC